MKCSWLAIVHHPDGLGPARARVTGSIIEEHDKWLVRVKPDEGQKIFHSSSDGTYVIHPYKDALITYLDEVIHPDEEGKIGS